MRTQPPGVSGSGQPEQLKGVRPDKLGPALGQVHTAAGGDTDQHIDAGTDGDAETVKHRMGQRQRLQQPRPPQRASRRRSSQ